MIVRGFSPSDVEAIITPLGFIVRRRGDHQQGTFRVQLKRHQWAYLFTPATDRYRLFSKQGKPTEQSCIHGLIAIIQALRAVHQMLRCLVLMVFCFRADWTPSATRPRR